MKIITYIDVNNVVLFAKRNMGVYKLVYKKYKRIYFVSLFSLFCVMVLTVVFLVYYFAFKETLYWLSYVCVALSVLLFVLLYRLDKKTIESRNKIQDIRVKILKKYYKKKKFKSYDVIQLNNQLQQRIDSIASDNIKFYVVLVSLLFPIWELYINKLGENVLFIDLIRMLIPRILFICLFSAVFFPFYNFAHKLFAGIVLFLNI